MKLIWGILFLTFVAAVSAQDTTKTNWPTLHTQSGKSFPAIYKIQFPLKLETSSLAYDRDDHSFYTTIDKGEPHIVQFRLTGDSIEIIRTGVIKGIDKNYDFEGIEVVKHFLGGKFLYVSTERLWENDSLKVLAVDINTWAYDSSKSFSMFPDGVGTNNNLEGLAASMYGSTFFIGKERDPATLYAHNPAEWGTYLLLAEDSLKRLLGEPIAISALTTDSNGDVLWIVNRCARNLVAFSTGHPCDDRRSLHFLEFFHYTGIDYDDYTHSGISDYDKYGLVEGIAFTDIPQGRCIALITDPGFDAYPTFVVFPYPTQ